MRSSALSILVVDDAKFSSAVVSRTLTQAGYTNIRYASSAVEALRQMQAKPANLLLADWLMPEMDGLQLTRSVRQHDAAKEHYTYVILLTGKEGNSALVKAFEQGVDDFICKSVIKEQLIPRVYAASRLYKTLLKLMHDKHALTHDLHRLESLNQTDPVTGLGNQRMLQQKLVRSLRQLEARGGTLCYLLFQIDNLADHDQQYGRQIYHELLLSIGQRLQQLIRPLDTLAYLGDNQFVMLTMLPKGQECVQNSFKRLHDGLNLKAYKTSADYLNIQASLSLITLQASALPINSERIMAQARDNLALARHSGRLHMESLHQPAL